MHKLILALSLLFLAPAAAFGQIMCCEQQVEVYYSQIFLDDSGSDPDDQNAIGVLMISGIGYVDAQSNPYGHSYSTDVQIFVPSGGYYSGAGGVSFPWDGTEGYYTNQSTHTISCPICNCSWTSSSNVTATANVIGATELYYGFDGIGVITPNYKTCNYIICEWSRSCTCYNFFRSTATWKCDCPTACSIGLVQKYLIHRWDIPFFGIDEHCTRYDKHPINFDPCVPAPSWDPICSITFPPFPLPH
jgi:hypothetical protein